VARKTTEGIKNVEKSGGMWGILCIFDAVNLVIKYVRMRFLGNIEAKTDTKGRVFLPAAFRKVLGTQGEEGLVMRKDVFQPCLVLYPESVWNEQMDTLRSRLSRWNAAEQQIFRQFVSDVELIALDGNGRFLIPKRYLKMAAIGQRVKFIGMGDTIEIWSNENTESPFLAPEAFSKAIEGAMQQADRQPETSHDNL
jgi:MraZ protein